MHANVLLILVTDKIRFIKAGLTLVVRGCGQ